MTAPVNKPSTRGWRHIVEAMGYSWKGLRAAVRHEEAFRIELWLMVPLLPLALVFGQSGLERALLVSSLVLVLFAELINSAIEAVVDRIGIEYHELSGRAKDIGSAGVFLALVNVTVVWGFLLCDHLIG